VDLVQFAFDRERKVAVNEIELTMLDREFQGFDVLTCTVGIFPF